MEFSCFQELGLLRRDADGRVFHALFQHSNLVSIAAAAEGGLPAFPDTLWVFNGARMLQNTAGSCAVGEELGSVLLTGDSHADGVLCHGNGAVAYETVESQAGDMQNIGGPQRDCEFLTFDSFVRTPVVGVVQLSVFVSVHGHLVGHQRV